MAYNPLKNGFELFKARMDEYERLRFQNLYFSVRQKRRQMWTISEEEGKVYEDILDEVIDNIKESNQVAQQHAADEVLEYVRSALIKHAKSHRDKSEAMFSANIFDPMTTDENLNPWSFLQIFLPDQKHMLQMLGVDIESQALVKHCDNALLKMRKIRVEDILGEGHEIFIMKEEACKAFEYLRIGRCG